MINYAKFDDQIGAVKFLLKKVVKPCLFIDCDFWTKFKQPSIMIIFIQIQFVNSKLIGKLYRAVRKSFFKIMALNTDIGSGEKSDKKFFSLLQKCLTSTS